MKNKILILDFGSQVTKLIARRVREIGVYSEILNYNVDIEEDYQKIIYEVGKEIYPDNLRGWFISLYQILFGSDSGPRLGSFFKVFGKEKVLILLKSSIN